VLQDYVLADMDGLQLIAALRELPGGSEIPVVLITGIVSQIGGLRSRADAHTRVLAKPIQPSRLIEIVNAQLANGSSPLRPSDRVETRRELPAVVDPTMVRQQAIQAAALSVIRGLSQALAQPGELPRILGDVLVHSLDAAGLSTGLLFLANQSGRLVLQAQAGLPSPVRPAASLCFGHPEVLQSALDSGEPQAYGLAEPGLGIGARAFLEGLAKTSALIVPFVVESERVGALALAADSPDLSAPTWLGFARALGTQFGQAIALGRTLARGAASEARYRSLMEHANDAILVFSTDSRVLEANRRAEELLGWPRNEIVGRAYESLFAPEDRAGLALDRASLLAERAIRVEGRHLVRADAAVIPVDVSASLVRIGEEGVVLSILRDTRERKQAEDEHRLLSVQLVQAQKMEAVGRLAGGVAHDFNNLLGVITGYSELLQNNLGPGHPGAKRLEQIQRAAERAAGLTRQLLAFSRKQVSESRVLDLNQVVGEVEKMLRRVIGEDIHLVTRLGEDLGRIQADAGQIEQVLMNLAVNARDAMPRGGDLVLATRNVAVGEAEARAHPEVRPGPLVMLEVSDTGEGMDAHTRARIFEPFFTTKEEGKGTGLGLATVFGIVEQSGGCIRCVSQLGAGTTFTLYFPRVEEALSSAPEVPRAAPPTRGTETVLLVEDADSLRVMIREILEGAGYTVLEAADPEQALHRAAALATPIGLLLSDVVLPRISGPDLAQRVRLARPGIKVLFMSGYAQEATGAHGTIGVGTNFIQKPFAADALLLRVREAIDEP
jgi:PAS domain S-box-containing protein